MGNKVSMGWTGINASLMNDAVSKMSCPLCKAPENENCKTPSGKERQPHMDRTSELMKKVGVFQYVKGFDPKATPTR